MYGDSYEDIGRRVPDVTKMQRVLGVRADTPLADGLRQTIEWFRASDEPCATRDAAERSRSSRVRAAES